MAILLPGFIVSLRADDPILGAPVIGTNSPAAQLSLTNCSDTNFLYVIQVSTNLTDWTSLITNLPAADGSFTFAPATNPACYFRVHEIPRVPIPMFRGAVTVLSNFNFNGNNCTVDSYDSSMTNFFPNGLYNSVNRRAHGDVASVSSISPSFFEATNHGAANIYGRVFTGPGLQASAVQVGPNGAVGDVAWNTVNTGIEPGYWSGNFYFNFPDVPAPTFSGATLPSPTNGTIFLMGGIAYTTAADPGRPIVVKGPGTVRLWVQGGMSAGNGITMSNSGSMVLYLGTTNTANSDGFTNGGQTAINYPGIAKNLLIYGLPSVKTITFAGDAGFAATVYAPEADVTGTGGGNNTLDTIGSFVVNSITNKGHWNFHFDENLLTNGPAF